VLAGATAWGLVVAVSAIGALIDGNPESFQQIQFFSTTGVAQNLLGEVGCPILSNRASHVGIGLVDAGAGIPSLAQSEMYGLADVNLRITFVPNHVHEHDAFRSPPSAVHSKFTRPFVTTTRPPDAAATAWPKASTASSTLKYVWTSSLSSKNWQTENLASSIVLFLVLF
jgi:hypothetical protein